MGSWLNIPLGIKANKKEEEEEEVIFFLPGYARFYFLAIIEFNRVIYTIVHGTIKDVVLNKICF